MTQSDIIIRGAREHNLRDVDLTLPRNQLIVMTGVSGSGKSSLAFDTLYAEGQRRYVESLSSYARQFLGQMPKPEVDSISGLSPSISIQQKTAGRNPRSTVGTITEIYDYLRVLFARVGQGHCEKCGQPITAQSVEQILGSILTIPAKTRFTILAPLIQGQKGEYRDLFEDLLKQGFLRARVDGEIVQLTQNLQLDRQMRHNIEVVIDRLVAGKSNRARIAEAVETALKLSGGMLIVAEDTSGTKDSSQNVTVSERLYSANYACVNCGISYERPSPQLFSFNSPQGMCPACTGLGKRHDFLLDRMIPDEKLSLRRGAIEPLGKFKEMGRWRRHIYVGVAAAIEGLLALKTGSLLKTPWKDLSDEARQLLLYGTGDLHITFSWGHSGGTWKHGGTFEGIIPELLDNYRKTNNPMRRRQLEKYLEFIPCMECHGDRLNGQARNVRLTSLSDEYAQHAHPMSLSLPEVCALSIQESSDFFEQLELSETAWMIAEEAIKEIRGRLGFLLRCGLDYLALDRTAPTLSGGESQRIRLAGQIGCGLVGVVYILDEPSIGLHPRDNEMLLESLCDLRDQGNTVIVVEHDEETMRAADYMVDFGPGPGVRGGEVVAKGSLRDVQKAKKSLTGQYLSGKLEIAIPEVRRPPKFAEEKSEEGKSKTTKKKKPQPKQLRIVGAAHNNLNEVDVAFPLETFICVTGVSGSGKSSLVNDILWQVLNKELNKGNGKPGDHTKFEGLEFLDKAIDIDQSPIGRTPRSNPATYVKLFDLIRALFTKLPESKLRGYKPGRFSFNVAGGRCEACEGYGSRKLEMDFLADVWVTCHVCNGHRFNHETLEVRFKEKSIADILEMDIQEAIELFQNQPKILKLLTTLHDVGLDYLKLGQPSPTLSGGEAQRIKLARELGKRSTGSTIYLLDEPTTGLHFADVQKLLEVLHGFVEQGNTVLVVEHNIDVLKTADWIIDLGPEGGKGGGTIVCQGTPETIAACEASHTGRALKPVLERTAPGLSNGTVKRKRGSRIGEKEVVIRGAAQHNLQDVDINLPRNKMSVFCGPSGSGKSSLAMETLYAEGQRRYVESLSAYARQFLGQMPKPKVEHIHGLSPAIAIEQKTVGSTPRSTVGTVTEIYDYLRILFARLGTPHCPDCQIPIDTQTTDDVIDKLISWEDGTKILLLAPQEVPVGQSYEKLWEKLKAQGFLRVRINGETHRIDEAPEIDRKRKHQVEIVMDRITISKRKRGRIADSVEAAFDLGRGMIHVAICEDERPETDWETERFSLHFACHQCGRNFEELTPHNFSFNSHLGWCPACEGLGIEQGRSRGSQKDGGGRMVHSRKTLLEGAITAWPNLQENEMFHQMMVAVAKEYRFDLDVPFEELSPNHQRTILQGAGDKWFDLRATTGKKGVLAQFQYKGIYPALEEASRVSYGYRRKLQDQLSEVTCSTCHGARLRDDAAAVRFAGKTIHELSDMPLNDSLHILTTTKLSKTEKKIAGDLLQEATSRLKFLVDVGLHYLSLSRPLPTLSGGESQRIRLAGQIGRALTGVLYVLDEPTIGLHPRDNNRLIEALHRLRDLGNTLVLVEHDREVLEASDRLYDFGPGAGRFGGQLVAQGTPKQLAKRKTLTGDFLSDRKSIPIPDTRRVSWSDSSSDEEPTVPPGGGWLELLGARHHNLRDVDLRIPLGTFTCVTGVSGSGKSSLIEETLSRAVARKLNRSSSEAPGDYDELHGLENINKQIVVDQQPLGNTPASNPATYTGVFDHIRQLFSQLPEAKMRGYKPGRFSFNRSGGRCETCEGNGQMCIEMHFLPDVWVECEDCRGKRYNPETLAVTYRGHSIADVLEMSIGQAAEVFENIPKIRSFLATLCAIGLDYLTLGQSAPTLSGGEAQRVKLAAELARPNTGKTLYLLDEPTTGLHLDDIAKLLKVLNSLVEAGNTVVVIEHNLDVIKTADWIVDLGPEAGSGGGWIVASGTPEEIVARHAGGSSNGHHRSYTAEVLAPVLQRGERATREIFDVQAVAKTREDDLELKQVGKETKMPWTKDGRGWHTGEHLGHNGKPCRWEGEALSWVADEISGSKEFAEPNWNHRSIVEITNAKKEGGWFLHAITGEEWLLKLKFRVKKGTFEATRLQQQLGLKPLEEINELPVYHRTDRVRVLNPKGPWQEIIITVHWLKDIQTPEFKEFLETAKTAYLEQATKKLNITEVTPWKVLKRKWHVGRKGFASGKRVKWPASALESLFDLLEQYIPETGINWSNKSVVNFTPEGSSKPWAALHTKRREGIDLLLYSEPGEFALGRVTGFGEEQEITTDRNNRELIKLRFTQLKQVNSTKFQAFLKEHFEAQL